MNTFKLHTRFVDNIECYIENIGSTDAPRYCAKSVATDEPMMVLNIPGYNDKDFLAFKDYNENQGLIKCLIDEGLIEDFIYSKEKVNYVELETHKITDKFRECIKWIL